MAILRLLLPLAIVVGLVIFAVSNDTPAVPLVLLGTPTPPLPLAVWVLGAIAAGAATTLAITALAQVPAAKPRQFRSRGYGDRPPYRPAYAQGVDEEDDDWQIEELDDDRPPPRDSPPGARGPTSDGADSFGFGRQAYSANRTPDRYDDPEAEDWIESDRPPINNRSDFRDEARTPAYQAPERPADLDDLDPSERSAPRRSPLDDWDTFSTPRQSWDDWQMDAQPTADRGQTRRLNWAANRNPQQDDKPPRSELDLDDRAVSAQTQMPSNRNDNTVLQDWGGDNPSDWSGYSRPAEPSEYDPDADIDAYPDGRNQGIADREPEAWGDRDFNRDERPYDEDDFYPGEPDEPEFDAAQRWRNDDDIPYAPPYPPREYEVDAPEPGDSDDYQGNYPPDDYLPRDEEEYGPYAAPYDEAAYEPAYGEVDDDEPLNEDATEVDDAAGSYIDYVRYNEDDDYYDDFEDYNSPASQRSRRPRSSSKASNSGTAEAGTAAVDAPASEAAEDSLLDLDDLEDWGELDSPTHPDASAEEASSDQAADQPRRIVEIPHTPQTVSRQGTIYSYSYRNPEDSGVGRSESVFEAKDEAAAPPTGEAASDENIQPPTENQGDRP